MLLNSDLQIFEFFIDSILFVLQFIIVPVAIYLFVISIFGWVKRKEESADNYPPVNRFAIVVAAHNEEKVIGNIVRNLTRLDYPAHLYDIFVIADNCSDNTYKIARENGAIAFERFDDKKRGKGFALEWMFEKIFKMEKHYDAVCVLDADNLVSLNFLKEMNKQLCKGHKVIQGYLDSKNPNDSFIAASYSATFWTNNRIFQLARYYLGLSCVLGGTGFVVSTDLLKEIGWGATSLTEDLEFTIKLVLKGEKVYWSHEAVVYDEKPLTMKQSWRQRKRWMQGQADCACRYFKALLSKAIKEKDIVAFDNAVYVVYPLFVVLGGLVMLGNFLKLLFFTEMSEIFDIKFGYAVIMFLVTTYMGIIFIALEGKLSWKILGYYILYPFYNITWIPIMVQGYIDRNKKEWVHTLHTRALDLSDIRNLGKAG
ncbi:glycosyltransferase family 2 protein [Acetivibrio clariflavus]|uniref:Glycosyl transferase n=1 Tax=Acetivibrio clariflavus (strain DSM 19732 / NBRC 101661 / EBR45) TaxID=720554 RepID=G8M366_ACECE|nr:glycosyltransferase family 2 protein [Acetivibrio clariflavus]AEV70386.1 glycosyl transferase [Acetivibrio clariflavus DSM 19732]